MSTLLTAAVVGLVFGIYSLYHALDLIPVRVVPDGISSAELVERDGVVVYKVEDLTGQTQYLSAQAFVDQIYRQQTSQTLGYKVLTKVLNISSVATIGWVIIGLGGQILFASRMVVQWLASEKLGKSVVPSAFWWLALGGASMLIIYFIWRRDIVGILGQATGWLIYIRNLYFIYLKEPRQRRMMVEADAADAATPADSA